MDKLLKNAIGYIDNSKDDMLNLWEELVNIDSGTKYKEGVDFVAKKLKELYEDIGFSTKTIENTNVGNTLIGETKDKRKGKGVLILGHMDTVFEKNTATKRPFKIIDDKAYGPGVLDMKGGLVIGYFAAKALQKSGYTDRPIKIIFSGDEEVGHKDSDGGQIIIDESKGYAASFNCETGFLDNGVVVERKGDGTFIIEVHGIAAHAGNAPEKGRSAILEAAHKTIAIHELSDFEEGTTYNVGVIEGGTVSNAVPDYARMEVDFRLTDVSKYENMVKDLEKITNKSFIEGTKSEITGGTYCQPMKRTEGVMELFEHYKKTAVLLGYEEPYPKKSGGGADSAYTVIAGVPSICAIGVKGDWNHSPEEVANVESLFERAKILVASIITLDEDLI